MPSSRLPVRRPSKPEMTIRNAFFPHRSDHKSIVSDCMTLAGSKRTYSMYAGRLQAEVRWWPFQLNPDASTQGITKVQVPIACPSARPPAQGITSGMSSQIYGHVHGHACIRLCMRDLCPDLCICIYPRMCMACRMCRMRVPVPCAFRRDIGRRHRLYTCLYARPYAFLYLCSHTRLYAR